MALLDWEEQMCLCPMIDGIISETSISERWAYTDHSKLHPKGFTRSDFALIETVQTFDNADIEKPKKKYRPMLEMTNEENEVMSRWRSGVPLKNIAPELGLGLRETRKIWQRVVSRESLRKKTSAGKPLPIRQEESA